MSDTMEVYYFSPTGGTKKVSDIFAAAVGKEVIWHDLGDKQTPMKQPQGELIVVAAPVFAGRIPSVVREKIKTLAGEGKKAVTIAVYGNRAYEDALLEMNDILIQGGFTVIASAAFVAQHSIVPEVGAGRPDAEDIKEIRTFFVWPAFMRVRSRQEFFRLPCSKKQIICLLHSRLSEIKMKPFSKSFCLYAL